MEESRFKSGILLEPFQRWGGFFMPRLPYGQDEGGGNMADPSTRTTAALERSRATAWEAQDLNGIIQSLAPTQHVTAPQ